MNKKAYDIKMPKVTKGHNSGSIFFQKLIRSSTHQPGFKALASNSF